MILEQKQTKSGQAFPSPRLGEVMYETPPTFVFLKEDPLPDHPDGALKTFSGDSAQTSSDDASQTYLVEVFDAEGHLVWSGTTDRNFITPDHALPAGQYSWNLKRLPSSAKCQTSDDQPDERGLIPFSISEKAVTFLRPDPAKIYESIPPVRPRDLFFREDIPDLLASHPEALDTLKRNVALALEDGLPDAPRFDIDPEAVPYREYFGRYRDFCDRNLVACALAYALLKDCDPALSNKAGALAKDLFLTICSWDSEGICSMESTMGDEIGLSNARCLPAVFDLLYPLLSKEERTLGALKVSMYAYQCERRLDRIDFCQNPGNSHVGRLPAYLGEAAITLKDEGVVPDDVLRRWLSKAIDIYSGIFPYFGGPDGGWAEGVFYATSYTKWYLPFFNAVRRFSGTDFLIRPFYQRLIDYYQHFCPPGWEIHPFGDGYWCLPDDPEWPGFFAQDPYGIYADRFGSELTKKWRREAGRQDIFKLHLLDVFLPADASESDDSDAALSTGVTKARLFPDAGYLSLHTDPEHPASELVLLARGSRFGSISHSHADQGSFALMAGGTALISPSGYFGRAYGTPHHFQWTNQSIAHNTLLIGVQGQDTFSYQATGQVLYAEDRSSPEGTLLVGALDASAAYPSAHPTLQKWTRSFELSDSQLIVTDHLELSEPASITYLLHGLSAPFIHDNTMEITRNGWHLTIEPLQGDLQDPSMTDRFATDLNEGVPKAYQVTAPTQYHMSWQTPARKIHDLQVRFSVTDLNRSPDGSQA